jgi:glycosyltransferase involved in cell wall biosynthesis
VSKADAAPLPRYRFGFILTTAGGNMTRYLNLRKYAERDPEVECVWAPCSHYLEPDPYRRYPDPIRSRLIMRQQVRPVFGTLSSLDAVMFHAFEAYVACAVRNLFAGTPLLVWSQDNPPASLTGEVPQYPGMRRARLRQYLRYKLDLWCLSRTALSVPWSEWAGKILVDDCKMSSESVKAINVGLDLELWRYHPKPACPPGRRIQILFVGASFIRKGGDLLLDVFTRHFSEVADLHIVTLDFEGTPPPDVYIHSNFKPNDEGLLQLYAASDLFVMPTRADQSPFVLLEAMAIGLPLITTRVGGIGNVVADGETGFLIDVDDAEALAHRLRLLIADGELRQRMAAQSAAFVDREYSSARNVPRILEAMKRAVDRNGESSRRSKRAFREGT